jgi:hypothetical protein
MTALLFPRLALAAVLVAVPATTSAQWPDYEKASAPRTADGKVDLNGAEQVGHDSAPAD